MKTLAMKPYTQLGWALTLISTASILGGCSELGMCRQDSLVSRDSPSGTFSAEIVSADCVGTSKAKWVILHRLEGTFKGSKTVAVFDDSNPDSAADLAIRWEGDKRVIIRAHGAKPWSFSPYWRGIDIEDR